MSKDALNHRFRRLRAQAKIIQSGREQGYDMKDLDEEKNLPGTQESVDHKSMPLQHCLYPSPYTCFDLFFSVVFLFLLRLIYPQVCVS